MKKVLLLLVVLLVLVLVLSVFHGVSAAIPYRENAVLIQNEDWFSSMNSVLENRLSEVVSNLVYNNVGIAVVFLGNIYGSGVIYQERSDAVLQSIVDAFHGEGIQVVFWVENTGSCPNLDSSHRGAIYSQIESFTTRLGADGYWDDIEGDPTHQIPSNSEFRQVWLDYQNTGFTTLAAFGKSWSTAYGVDWVTNVNHYLHVTKIYSMFYSESASAFEDSVNIYGYWLENMGLGVCSAYAPASPVVPIVMVNGFAGEKPLSFQLGVLSNLLSTVGSGPYDGVGFWIYETTTSSDWQTINAFTSDPLGFQSSPGSSIAPGGGSDGQGGGGGGYGPNPTPTHTPNPTSSEFSPISFINNFLSIFSDTAKFCLLLAVGFVAFVFAGKKR